MFDACVVGTGFAGTLVARKLAARGASVAMLESGVGTSQTATFSYSLDPATPSGYTLVTNHRWVGGHSNCWGGLCLRLPKSVFEGSDGSPTWPISYSDLEPYYEQAEQILCPDGLNGPHKPQQQSFPQTMRRRLTGNQAPRDYLELFSDAVKTTAGFAPIRSGNSQMRLRETLLPELMKSGRVELVTGATASSVETSEDGTVTAIRYTRDNGETALVNAKMFILASGALETPRLLRLSRSRYFPRGIGNQNNQVGKNFSDHFALKPRSLCIEGSNFVPDGFYAHWRRQWARLRGDAGYVVVGTSITKVRTIKSIILEERLWGDKLRKTIDSEAGGHCAIDLLGGIAAHEANAVEIDESRTDWTGRPIAKLRLQPSERDWLLLEEMETFTRRVFDRMGLKQLVFGKSTFGSATFTGGHLLSTCRMGTDPRMSVVDRDLRVHGTKNLFIAGGSVFTTPGAVNPTLTISALALRLGDFLNAAA